MTLPQISPRLYKIGLGLVVLGLIFLGLWISKKPKVEQPVVEAADCSPVSEVDNATVIRIQNGQFDPKDLTVHQCDTIMFLNLDETEHWPVSDGNLFVTGKNLVKYDYFTYRADRTGAYSYHDNSHPENTGKFKVSAP